MFFGQFCDVFVMGGGLEGGRGREREGEGEEVGKRDKEGGCVCGEGGREVVVVVVVVQTMCRWRISVDKPSRACNELGYQVTWE